MKLTNRVYVSGHPVTGGRWASRGHAIPGLFALALLMATAPAVLAQCAPTPSGTIVAWYPLDSTGVNLATQNNGTLSVDPPIPTGGIVLGGLYFNGIDTYIESPSTLVTNFGPGGNGSVCTGGDFSSCPGDFSFDAWVNIPSHPSSPMTILDKRGPGPIGYSIYVNSDRFGIQLADGTGTVGYDNYDSPDLRSFTTNAWHHLAIVVKRISYIRFYFDGVLRSQILPAHLGSLVNSGVLRIGANGPDNPSATGVFKGVLDEVDLYNRVLTPAEVQAIYVAGAYGKCK